MTRNILLIMTSVVSLFTFAIAPEKREEGSLIKNQALKPKYSQTQADAKKKSLEICVSYDETGRTSKISIRSNQTDKETTLRSAMQRKNVIAVIEELVPEAEKGAKIKEFKTFLGRALIESTIYEKIQIDLTIVCNESNCGVSYAEIRWRAESN